MSKPFPDRPYCQQTATNIGVQNNAGKPVSFCQTVLPGDEDMLIPTDVTSWSALAVPDPSYWAGTAAHYYINPPGVSSGQGCVWGTSSNPWGNWAAYVAGANADASGQTFIKLGWNPVYLEAATPFNNVMPGYGVKIDCPDGGCNGLPCSIDPSQNKVNEMIGSATSGAGSGAFCVVTVAKGSTANFVVFETGGSQDDTEVKGGQFYQSTSAAPTASVVSTTTAASSTYSTTTSSSSSVSSSWVAWSSSSATHNSTTSSEPAGPTGQPYYNLFNTSSTVEATNTMSSGPKPTASNAVVGQQKTGSASTVDVSFGMLMVGLGMLFL